MMRYFKILIMLLMAALLLGQANAQTTTSAMAGMVYGDGGEPLSGATVVALNVESGTQYATITSETGYYIIQGMRPGGPYKVMFSYVGMTGGNHDERVYLPLGETLALDGTLFSDNEIGAVLVQAEMAGRHLGAQSNLDAGAIASTPTVSRNVYDVARLNPLASISKVGGITFAGSNNRYNSFQIDGTVSNDVFGLSPSGTNGGQSEGNPISLDAIQEIQVVVAPFDVTQSGFTGGGINAVTKSGTNKVKGSVYGFLTNQGLYSKWSQPADEEQAIESQSAKTLGATLGAPIVKDKLFVFLSAENIRTENPCAYFPGASGYISQQEAQDILAQYSRATGIQELAGKRSVNKNSLNLLGRVDWNISQKHSLVLRYQFSKAYKDRYDNTSKAYYFPNSGFRLSNRTNSVVMELSSHFPGNIYNEFRASGTTVRDNCDVPYMGPSVQISSAGGQYSPESDTWQGGSVKVSIGTEYSSGANAVDVDVYTLEDNLTVCRGSHTITMGTHEELYRTRNLFIQNCTGTYLYNSTQDFLDDNAYRFQYNYSDPQLTGSTRWAGTTKAGQYGFYAQDKWAATSRLRITYGLRVDIPVMLNSPTENPDFNASAYASKFGVRVGEAPSAKVLWSPRAGFKWASSAISLQGGVGIFTGRVPFVWLTNLWNNTGMEMKGITISKDVPSFLAFASDPEKAMGSSAGSASKPTINTADKAFKYPQVLRASLLIGRTLPGGVNVSLNSLLSKTMNNVFFENLALESNGKVYAVEGVEASASPYYSANYGDYYTIINLKNTGKGYTYSLTAKAEAPISRSLYLMAAYTFGHSKSVNDGTSSVAASNWKYNYSRDPNSESELAYSFFDVPHRIIASASYTTPQYLRGLMSTTVSVTYSGASGQRYCLTMNESADFNGDTQKGNSLLYIPTDSELEKMSFATPGDREQFRQWIHGDKYASSHRGQYACRYSSQGPFEHHWDLHVSQDICCHKERGSKIQLTLDIINFGNLLCRSWGTYYESAYNISVLKCVDVDKETRVASFAYNNQKLAISDLLSRWHAQVGVRFVF